MNTPLSERIQHGATRSLLLGLSCSAISKVVGLSWHPQEQETSLLVFGCKFVLREHGAGKKKDHFASYCVLQGVVVSSLKIGRILRHLRISVV